MANKELTRDEIQLRVVIDGTPARKDLAETTAAVNLLKEAQKDLKKQEADLLAQRKAAAAAGNEKEVQRYNTELAKLRETYRTNATAIGDMDAKQKALRESIGTTGLSMSELRTKAQGLRAALDKAAEGTDAYRKLDNELAEVEKRLSSLRNATLRQLRAWEETRKGMTLDNMTLEQLKLEQQYLEQLRDTTVTTSPAFATLGKELDVVNERLRQSTNAAAQTEKEWEQLRKGMRVDEMTLEQLQREEQYLKKIRATLPTTTEEYARLDRELLQVEQTLKKNNSEAERQSRVWDGLRSTYKLADLTLEQLAQEQQRLNLVLAKTKPNTEEFRAYNRELQAVKDRSAALSQGLSPMARLWRNIKTEMSGVLGVTAGLFAGGFIVSKIQEWVKSSAQLSDKQADVQRTTGLTTKEVNRLTASLAQLNTRTARTELLDLAADAGKLGIQGRDDILAFVKAGDQIKVALGEDLGEDAIKQIGKLNQTFAVGEATGKGLEAQMLSTGSAVNALGQASTASEAFLVDFTTRQAGVNTQAKINIQSTLGYAAALDQLGQRSETSSTALAQFTLKAFSETATYAKIAGMGVKEFTELLNADANEALLRTLEGLNGNNQGLSTMTGLFADLGQEGARAVGVLASLSTNTKLVRDQQAIANREFERATSITAEFNTRNNTLGANLDIIGKRLIGAFVNNGVVNAINSMANGLRRMIEVPVSETLETERISMQALYAQILTLNVGSEKRTALVKELQAQYPEYLGYLNAETVSNKRLGLAVKDLNEQLVNKIILQKKDEEIQAQIDETAARKDTMLKQEDDVRNRMVKLADEYNLKLAEGVSINEQSAQLVREIEAIRIRTNRTGGGIVFDEVARLAKATNELRISQAYLNTEQNTTNKLTEERAALLARLNIKDELNAVEFLTEKLQEKNTEIQVFRQRLRLAASDGERLELTQDIAALEQEKIAIEQAIADATRPNAAPVVSDPDNPESTDPDAARQKAKDQLDALLKDQREFARRMALAKLSDDEREIRELDNKHADELTKVRTQQEELVKAKKVTPEQAKSNVLELERTQGAERAELIEQQGERRLQAFAVVEAQITGALKGEYAKRLVDELAAIDAQIVATRARGQSTAELERQRRTIYLRISEEQSIAEIQAEMQKWDDLIALGRKYNMDVSALENARANAGKALRRKRHRDELTDEEQQSLRLRQERAQQLQQYAGLAAGVGSIFASIQQMEEQRADADGVRTQREQQRIRNAAITTIAIQTGVAIANGVASVMSSAIPFPGNLLAAAPTIATIIGLMATASSYLNASGPAANNSNSNNGPSPIDYPTGAQGATISNGVETFSRHEAGVLKGPSHSEGGLDVVNPKTGQKVAEFEGDETYMLFSKAFTRSNQDQLGALVAASRNGTRLNLGEPMRMPNPARVQQAMSVAYMAQGGIVPTSGGSTFKYTKGNGGLATEDEGTTTMIALLAELVATQKRTAAAAERFPTELTARAEIGPATDRKNAEWQRIKDRHKVSRSVA